MCNDFHHEKIPLKSRRVKLYYTFLMEYQYICRYIFVSTYTEKYWIEIHQNVYNSYFWMKLDFFLLYL